LWIASCALLTAFPVNTSVDDSPDDIEIITRPGNDNVYMITGHNGNRGLPCLSATLACS